MTECRVTRTIHAPIEQVWQAWTDPSRLARWYCPNPALTLAVEADPVVGGRYRVDMGGKFAVGGEYLRVREPDLLEFTWKWDHEDAVSTVCVELRRSDAGTDLVLTQFDLVDDQEAHGHSEGWQLSLARLEQRLA